MNKKVLLSTKLKKIKSYSDLSYELNEARDLFRDVYKFIRSADMYDDTAMSYAKKLEIRIVKAISQCISKFQHLTKNNGDTCSLLKFNLLHSLHMSFFALHSKESKEVFKVTELLSIENQELLRELPGLIRVANKGKFQDVTDEDLIEAIRQEKYSLYNIFESSFEALSCLPTFEGIYSLQHFSSNFFFGKGFNKALNSVARCLKDNSDFWEHTQNHDESHTQNHDESYNTIAFVSIIQTFIATNLLFRYLTKISENDKAKQHESIKELEKQYSFDIAGKFAKREDLVRIALLPVFLQKDIESEYIARGDIRKYYFDTKSLSPQTNLIEQACIFDGNFIVEDLKEYYDVDSAQNLKYKMINAGIKEEDLKLFSLATYNKALLEESVRKDTSKLQEKHRLSSIGYNPINSSGVGKGSEAYDAPRNFFAIGGGQRSGYDYVNMRYAADSIGAYDVPPAAVGVKKLQVGSHYEEMQDIKNPESNRVSELGETYDVPQSNTSATTKPYESKKGGGSLLIDPGNDNNEKTLAEGYYDIPPPTNSVTAEKKESSSLYNVVPRSKSLSISDKKQQQTGGMR